MKTASELFEEAGWVKEENPANNRKHITTEYWKFIPENGGYSNTYIKFFNNKQIWTSTYKGYSGKLTKIIFLRIKELGWDTGETE